MSEDQVSKYILKKLKAAGQYIFVENNNINDDTLKTTDSHVS
jgi:hypothetical protein